MTDQHQGWAGEDAAARAWDVFGDSFDLPGIVGADARQFAGRTFRAWDVVPDHVTFPQQTGDCVAVSTCDCLDMIAQIEIAMGDAEEFHRLYPPFLYATSRVLIGQNRLKGRGGSVGSWMAKALETYGALRSDITGVPAYSGRTADEWGDGKGDWRRWLPEAAPHTVSVTFLDNWEQLVEHMCRGYLCTMASSLGFNETPDRDGFNRQTVTWNHSMAVFAISDDRQKPWLCLHNQWGPRGPRIADFETGELWPTGMLRVRPDDIQRAFTHGEVIAYSKFNGFADRDMPAKWET